MDKRKFNGISGWVIFFSSLVLAGLWLAVYSVRTYQLQREISSLRYPVQTFEYDAEKAQEVSSVKVVLNDVEYDLDDVTWSELPEVVQVHVYYGDGYNIVKKAYIVRDDVYEVSYEDNAYGRFVLPRDI